MPKFKLQKAIKKISSKRCVVLLGAIILIALFACNSNKGIESKPIPQAEINIPFSESKYRSDQEFFRARQTGKSPDLATAKKIALLNAKAEMAGNIRSTIKRVTEQYTYERIVDDKLEFENGFAEIAREVVNQSLNDVRIIDDKIFREGDGSFSYWIAIEVSKGSIVEGVNNKISQNDKLQSNYEKNKFEEIFNHEMEKFFKER
jgi:hypothetical protein